MKQLVETDYTVTSKLHDIKSVNDLENLISKEKTKGNIYIFSLPEKFKLNASKFIHLIKKNLDNFSSDATLGFIGDNEDIAYISHCLVNDLDLNYGLWIALRKKKPFNKGNILPNETAALTFFTIKKKLSIARVRLPYTYCPACGKTTKDYGGKKHTFHEYGTTMSDVWKDIYIDRVNPFPNDHIKRIEALFSTAPGREINVISLYNFKEWDSTLDMDIASPIIQTTNSINEENIVDSKLLNGDVLEELRKLPDNSVDYVFADPPYNLKKKYASYSDNLEIENYFTWCDKWLAECSRILKPGRYMSILNIPLWAIRHYSYLEQTMEFESWITWDALSRPGGNIMPANYALLTFKKNHSEEDEISFTPLEFKDLQAEADYYCLRASCKKSREPQYKPVTDLWTDIHRLKHNSHRYDHPCQLPPAFMERLIKIYSNIGETVLDPFNGVGTSSLVADMLDRKYIGIEIDEQYVKVTEERHAMISRGENPFGKNNISTEKKTKNNNAKRIQKKDKKFGDLTKKSVQLQIKDLAKELGYEPTKEEAIQYLSHIPEEFYSLYFSSWGEVTIAVNVNGAPTSKENSKGNISSRREDTKVEQIKLDL